MKNKTNKFMRFLTTFLTLTIIIFAVCFFTKIVVDDFFFAQKTIAFRYIYLEVIAILISSALLTLFYQINRITLFVQVLVTYSIITIDIYFLGVISGWFNYKNIAFFITSICVIVAGALLILAVTFIRRYIQQKRLNKELASIKEEDNHEKN